MDKKPYRVGATPLLLDGERVEPGQIVELVDNEAAALSGHVVPCQIAKASTAPKPTTPTTEPAAPTAAPEAAVAEPETPVAEADQSAEPATPKKGAKA